MGLVDNANKLFKIGIPVISAKDGKLRNLVADKLVEYDRADKVNDVHRFLYIFFAVNAACKTNRDDDDATLLSGDFMSLKPRLLVSPTFPLTIIIIPSHHRKAVVALDIIMASTSAPKRMRSPDAKPVKHLILITLSKLMSSTDLQAPLNSNRRIFRKVNKICGFPKDNVTWFLGADITKSINPHFASKENFSNHVRSVFDDASPDDVVLMVYSGHFKPMRHHHELIFEGV
ncbi:hypothetical protein RIF29_23905 [Crotalaria pallida]|uniref:Uncharacterized protein n=1 Tax=Crotalaria pallida TaxID=3830 RepID=A0AAN9EIT9_CROPI